MKLKTLMIDDSLSLINRTGAHYLAKDLVECLSDVGVIRRWRFFGAKYPTGIHRKILAKLMLADFRYLGTSSFFRWPSPSCLRNILFLDPLYTLRSELSAGDIVLCHDVGPITHPDLYDATTSSWYRAAYEKISSVKPGLVFVSQTSLNEFSRLYGNSFRFMKVIPLYSRSGAVDSKNVTPVKAAGSKFFLSIGALERRKNHGASIDAFVRSGLMSEGYKLIICGPRGDSTKEVQRKCANTSGVSLLGYVSDAELNWLYANATAFVLPSRLEGFGMPALEAARHGLIPIISRDSALLEAVSGVAIQVDWQSVEQIASAMREVAELPLDARQEFQRRLLSVSLGQSRELFIERWSALLAIESVLSSPE